MRISKEKATAMATELTKPLADKVAKAKEELRVKVLALAEARIPKEVMQCFMEHPDYFTTHSRVYLTGEGVTRQSSVQLGKSLPGYGNNVTISGAQSKAVVKLIDALSNAEIKYEQTNQKIINTLLTLGSYARIKEQLPEVEKYLPAAAKNTAVMLPLKDIRKEIIALAK